MANRNTKAVRRYLRKEGNYFHGKPCNTSTTRECRRPKIAKHDHVFAVQRDKALEWKGLTCRD